MRALVLALVLASCGRSFEQVLPDGPTSDVHDERVPIPPPDPAWVDIVTPETTVAAGDTRMFCYYFTNPTGGDVAIDQVHGFQGLGGHHVSLMQSLVPKAPGTFEDCTSPQSNADLRWFALTTGFLPTGTAMEVLEEQVLVVQFHYINESDFPILVRDLLRMHVVDPATVTRWSATMVASNVNLDLPPGEDTLTWSCTLAEDRQLLELFGHMHQWGASMTIDIGPSADQLTRMYTVNPWMPDFKDEPPTTPYFDQPLDLPAGTVIRTSCTWMNTTDAVITFPSEMCFTFAYLGGSQTPLQCN